MMTIRRRLLLTVVTLLFLLAFGAPRSWAQGGNTVAILFPGVPSGSCAYVMVGIDAANGALYDCPAGSWVAVTGAGSMIYPGAGIAVSTGSAWGTSLTAPSGTIVGTTDTQTLTNKTVDGVTPTVFGYVDPTSSIQTQLNAKGNTTSTSLTTGYFPKASGANAIVNSLCDEGITTANVLTCTDTAGASFVKVSVPGDGTHAGSAQITGNTTEPTLGSNSFAWGGPLSASFTSFGWNPPTAENASAGILHVGAASSHWSALTISAIVGADMTNNTVTATQLAAQYSKGSCTEVWGGSGTSFALTSGDDAIADNACYNDSGVTRTITAVKCASDNASNTTTVNPTFGSAGTGTTILSGALTCGNSNAMSATGTVSNASWTTGSGIDPAMAGTLTGTHIVMIVEYTF